MMQEGVFKGREGHEIAFYFLMKSRGSQEVFCKSTTPDGKEFIKWIPISELPQYSAYPSFYIDKLSNISTVVEHIVTNTLK